MANSILAILTHRDGRLSSKQADRVGLGRRYRANIGNNCRSGFDVSLTESANVKDQRSCLFMPIPAAEARHGRPRPR